MSAENFWRANRTLQHITPPGEVMPEVGLIDALRRVCVGSVFEFGCGYGRLAGAFDAAGYAGYDINPAALQDAARRHPEHVFADQWAEADTFVAHTVLLHIDDADIARMVPRIRQYRRIVIGEILGRKWRRSFGEPMVFNRELDEYEAMFGPALEVVQIPYPRYKTHLSLMVFEP